MGYFTVSTKKPLKDLILNERIEESDYCFTDEDNNFIQLKYHNEEDSIQKEIDKVDVKPGIYTIKKSMSGLYLENTSFAKESILNQFSPTQEIEYYANQFISKAYSVYQELDVGIAKRGILIGGAPGGGKTTAIHKIINEQSLGGETLSVIWNTDQLDPNEVKNLFKSFRYVGVKMVILVAEDLGGIEGEGINMKSTSSLLALLDNKELAFTIPTLILSTTNYLEQFPTNITQRRGRFDHVVKFPTPNGDQRIDLLNFFSKKEIKESLDFLKNSKFNDFTPADLKEIVIRMKLYDYDVETSANSLITENANRKKGYTEKRSSIGFYGDDD